MKRCLWILGILLVAGATVVIAQPPGGPPSGGGPPGRGGGGRGGPGGGPPMNLLMEAIDTDHDGVISAEELKNASASLATLDKNKDGKLTEDEIHAGPPGGGGGRPGGGNRPQGRGPGGPPGGGGPDPERMVEHAMEFDANQDGKLDKEELKKFAASFVERPRPEGGGPGAGDPGGAPRPERPKRPE